MGDPLRLTRRATLAGLTAAPLAARAAGMLRVAVLSDLNGSYGSVDYHPAVHAAVARVVQLRPDLVLCCGDMVAGQRRPLLSPAEVAAMWAGFHAAVTGPLAAAGIPLAVTPGNHDASAVAAFAGERAAYAMEWASRRPAVDWVDGTAWPFAYAFRMGGVRFVSLDATVPGPLPAQQMRWLETVLPPRQERATIAFTHLPLAAITQGRETEIIGDPALAALLAQRRVDVLLSGHHHGFYPGWSNGLAQVAQACLGAGPRRLIGEGAVSRRAVTLLDIAADGAIAIRTLSGDRLEGVIDIAALPPRLGEGPRPLIRLDLSKPGDGRVPVHARS